MDRMRIVGQNQVLAAVAAMLLCATMMGGSSRAAAQEKEVERGWGIRIGQEVEISVRSHVVKWGGNDYWLVGLGRARFELAGAHLTAVLRGEVTTFDNVKYDVSCAVYDRGGALLGVARGEVEVSRIWVGVTGSTPTEVRMDFGQSLDFENAARFELAISREQVLTPDQWQK